MEVTAALLWGPLGGQPQHSEWNLSPMSRVSGTANLPNQHTLTKKKSGIIGILLQSLKGKDTFGKTETTQRPLRKAGCRQKGCVFLNIKKETAHGPRQTHCRSHIYGQINKNNLHKTGFCGAQTVPETLLLPG